MARGDFINKEIASECGKKSKRGEGVKTELTKYLLAKANATKNGEAPVTMDDLKKDSPAVWLWLRENASNWQEILLCESHLSKYLHVVRGEITGKDGKDLITDVRVTIIEGGKNTIIEGGKKMSEYQLLPYSYGIPEGFIDDVSNEDDPDERCILEEVQRNDFHIGQHYDSEFCRTLICRICKSDKFIVGVGNFFTGIKCINCNWETSIHEG